MSYQGLKFNVLSDFTIVNVKLIVVQFIMSKDGLNLSYNGFHRFSGILNVVYCV